MGKDRTAARVLRRFYWPTLFRDVAAYCKSCPSCQKMSRMSRPKAPLVPMPIIGEPFNQIAMDIVGPLPKSKRGNRYLLVVVDYATRYPEVFPLRTFTADVVAEKLVEVFARHGVPRTILTYQGSNFTSNLLQELHRAWIVNEKDWQRPCNCNTIVLTQQLRPFYGLVVTSSQQQLPIATLLKM